MKSTLEQWRMLKAVVDHGGFAQAAQAIHKSQSTINHAVHKLQDQLGTQLLEVRGRKAQLTDAGRLLLRRAGQLLEQAEALEGIADTLNQGEEAEIRLAIDELFPHDCLTAALKDFSDLYPNTRVQLLETVLSGGEEKLVAGEADLMIAGNIPAGFLGQEILRVDFLPFSHPNHYLQRLGALNLQDLSACRQIVVRDSALRESRDSGWLGAEQRWTVSHINTSIDMIGRGMGFAWLPLTRCGDAIQAGRLKVLPMESDPRRTVHLYLVFADPDRSGPATHQLARWLQNQAESYHPSRVYPPRAGRAPAPPVQD